MSEQKPTEGPLHQDGDSEVYTIPDSTYTVSGDSKKNQRRNREKNTEEETKPESV